jgi:hypothetical protein
MPKTRMNMMMRDSIKKKLISRAFDHREKELLDRRPALAKLIFDEIFSPTDQEKAAELPEGWLPYTTSVEPVDYEGNAIEGWHGQRVYSLELPFSERHPAMVSTKMRTTKMSDGLLEAVEEQFKAERDLWKAKKDAETNTIAVLASYNWVEDLITGWPEASSVIHEVVTSNGVIRDLPVVTHLNDLLGLPPGGRVI